MTTAINDLNNLPLSNLFAGPLLGAVDASIQAQMEKANLIQDIGFDDDGEPETVTFTYQTEEINPDTGETERVTKRLEIPLLLFLTFPNLVIVEVEEEFSADISQTEEVTRKREQTSRTFSPIRRLKVSPSSTKVARDRRTQQNFELDVKMLAEGDNMSVGMENLGRALETAVVDRTPTDTE